MAKTKAQIQADLERKIQFEKDNAVATRFEKEVFIRAIQSNPNFYFGFKWSQGSHPKYDILMTDKDDTHTAIEVKAQKIYSSNDYFSVETQQRNQPSGLSSSKSNYYYIFKISQDNKEKLINIYYDKTLNQTAENGIEYDLYEIKTDHLRQLIMNNNYPESNYSDNKKKGNIKYDIPIKDVTYNKKSGILNSTKMNELEKDNRLIFKRSYLEEKISSKSDAYILFFDRTYYTKNEYKDEIFNNPEILNQDNFIYNRADPSAIDYGYGKNVSPSNSDSSSSSEDDGKCKKVYNRLKRNIDKKYKIKKEKYL
jgi:hypothetical protein